MMKTEEEIEVLVGKPRFEIERLFGETEYEDRYEKRYVLNRYCYGLFVKRLHLYFYKGRLSGFYIGIL